MRPRSEISRKPVVVVGAGPVGLAAAIDLVLRGIKDVLIIDEGDGPAVGSRAICWSRRTLEILSRLGIGRQLIERGVTWQVGRVYHGTEELFRFDLQPEPGFAHPAFINLSQREFEAALIERLLAIGHPGVSWHHRVTGLERHAGHVAVSVATPDDIKTIEADWVIAADGARSTIRDILGLECLGRTFEDRFLIADVRSDFKLGNERWFWFHPPFHAGHSALMHRQPDSIFRLDFQLGVDADPVEERKLERIIPRLEQVLGDRSRFELVWSSVYIFQCRRLEHFLHGRVIFAGDSAHQVSPFGARGGNSGIQDVDNLAWKLALILQGKAEPSLLQSYDIERTVACDENIGHSTRATDFMSPKPGMATTLRDAVLSLASNHPFARRLINSGRLSVPAVLDGSPLNGPDVAEYPRAARPGAASPDAPVTLVDGSTGWLVDQLGAGFVGLYWPPAEGAPVAVREVAEEWRKRDIPITLLTLDGVVGGVTDQQGMVAKRYCGEPGGFVLIRPDQHVAARFRRFDQLTIEAALARAIGRDMPNQGEDIAWVA